ncbi:MAG: cyclic nucleotide-binding domain-containing protein [Variovorax sp.]|nr:MAG: cyclic nucleotide-binding domain-containing protein [Variovorax sp.]
MPFADSPVATPDLRAHAARLLMAAAPWAQLGAEDALTLIDAMRPVFAPSGSIVMEEGDAIETDYMALVLEGEVRAESSTGVAGEEVVISIIGPGGLIGEMGVIDGAPRSATCTALTDLKLATLSRHALMGLIDKQPMVAARLLMAISAGLSERLRESNRRLRTLSQVTRALQRELNATHAVNQRLLSQ